MPRSYAGIFGTLAFGVVTARSIFTDRGADSVLTTALGALCAFAAVGYIIGWIAERTLVEAIETRLQNQLQAEESSRPADVK